MHRGWQGDRYKITGYELVRGKIDSWSGVRLTGTSQTPPCGAERGVGKEWEKAPRTLTHPSFGNGRALNGAAAAAAKICARYPAHQKRHIDAFCCVG